MYGDPTAPNTGSGISGAQGTARSHVRNEVNALPVLGPGERVWRVLKVLFGLQQGGGFFGFEIIHHDSDGNALIGRSIHGQPRQSFYVGRKYGCGVESRVVSGQTYFQAFLIVFASTGFEVVGFEVDFLVGRPDFVWCQRWATRNGDMTLYRTGPVLKGSD